jgi:hypothetical protein
VVVLLGAIAVHLATGREELAELRRLSWPLVFATAGCQLAAQLLWNGAMLVPLRSFMPKLGYWELFMVRTGGFAAGYVVPVANLAVRMSYLKLRGLGYAQSAWATALSNVLAVLAGGVLAVAALGVLWTLGGRPPGSVVALAAAVLVLGLGGVVALYVAPTLPDRAWLRRWPRLSRLRGFTTARATMALVLALLFARHAFNFVTFGLLFRALAPGPLDLVSGGLVYAATSPIRVLTITPGNLGVNEWIVAAVASQLSIDLTTGLLAALVFRGVSLVGQGAGVLLGAAWLALDRARSRGEDDG